MFERGLLVVLLISQIATGYLLYSQAQELDRTSIVQSLSNHNHDKRVALLEDQMAIQMAHHHGTGSEDALANRLGSLESTHLTLLGGVVELKEISEDMNDDLSNLGFRFNFVETRLANIDCGEGRINVTRADLDTKICRRK